VNANEMADLMILFDSGRIYEHAEEIANMLRQQQAEIEELKAKLKSEFDYIEKKFSEEWWAGVKEYNEQRKKNK
jgi:hypothetical protein